MNRPPCDCERVLVLGNSGSLLEQPRQASFPDNLVTVGVNRILREGLDGRTYSPDIIVVSDGRVLLTEREAFEQYGGILMFSQWVGGTVPHLQFESRPSKRQHYRQDIRRFPVDWKGILPHINNVAFHAAMIAVGMVQTGGTVYLAGCEDHWPPPGDPRHPKHHFYDTGAIPKGLRPFGVNRAMARQWVALAAWVKSRGKRLVDTSPWRDLALPGLESGAFPE